MREKIHSSQYLGGLQSPYGTQDTRCSIHSGVKVGLMLPAVLKHQKQYCSQWLCARLNAFLHLLYHGTPFWPPYTFCYAPVVQTNFGRRFINEGINTWANNIPAKKLLRFCSFSVSGRHGRTILNDRVHSWNSTSTDADDDETQFLLI